jgi:predicted RecA/RadA family phage recombinase
MSSRLVHQGKSVQVTVPQSTTVNAGDFVLIEGHFGRAFQKIVNGAGVTAPLAIETDPGVVYETNQINAAGAFAKGSLVYFNTVTKVLENAAGANIVGPVGRVTVAKAAGVIQFRRFGDRTDA